jgi:hypothetical protein
MVYFDSATLYLQSKTTQSDRLDAIESIIDALILKAAAAADEDSGTFRYEEYFLNDGQTQIRARYRSVDDILNSIKIFERLAMTYRNRLNGRAIRMVDGKNFINNNPCG